MHNLCQTRKNQNLKGKIHHESSKERKHEAKSIDIYIINKEYIPSYKLNLPSKNMKHLINYMLKNTRNVIRRKIVQGESEENIKEIFRNTDEGWHAPQSFRAENKNISNLIDSLGLNGESFDLSSLSLKKIRIKTANYVEKVVSSFF